MEDGSLRLDASFVDYALVVVYFAVVLLIGFAARRVTEGPAHAATGPSQDLRFHL